MKKIVIAVLVIVLLVAGSKLLTKFKNRVGEISEKNDDRLDERVTEEESFVGKLKDAINLGKSLKCEYKVDDKNYGIGYLKGKNYYGEFVTGGKTAKMILKDKCFWSWAEGQKQGFKTCVKQEESENIWNDIDKEQKSESTDYRCNLAVINDTMFELPAGIEFVDLQAMMEKYGVTANP